MSYPKVHRLPLGYRKVSVVLTDREYERLRGAAALQPHGSFSEAVRVRLGMTPSPYRFMSRLREQHELEKRIYPQPDNNEE